ncbi:putative 4-diphosphocytidyl-2-C-methyl-D-erythritol kinase [Dissostichus eleginoides]|uniref:4-diphosphocytidyl-2-C-methyl-D-erythritol kinase n=1 Tax=Dissostichus eleginoides TaxID=100907 RepID=A0AAD9FF93_DISEL|nr:putative 4-diphosphocytidyl-2-C-methyl-D-erythritol kinase [Dissostichus eleginoides]
MTDMEQTFIRSAITEVLPDLPEMTKDILEETLQSLGVETYEDFQFVNEADLLSALRPIQARKVLAAWKLRCQTPESSSSSVGGSPGPSASLMSYSPRSSSSTSSDSCKRPDIDWMDSFVIPWDKFPEELMQTLERGKRPSPQMRREMVRILVCEMKRKNIIEGDVIGPGYHSLVKQLQNRIENVKRSTTPKIRKRKNGTDESDTDEVPPEQRAAIQDTYGCIKWDLKFLPLGETEESQQEKKEKLRRKQVNQGTNIKSLLQEWPFWFDDLGMAVHFKELTGSELQETFTRNLDLKGKRLLNYMNTVAVYKSKRLLQALTKFKVMRGELSGCSEDVKDMVLLLLSYFDEKEDTMFCYVEDTCLAGEVQMDQVQLTPTIVVCGK